MSAIAASLYLASTLAFGITAVVVGVRLVRSTRGRDSAPEWFLGMGIMGTAGFGYCVMMVGIIGRTASAEGSVTRSVFGACLVLGWIFHNLGVMSFLRFIVVVFRPGEVFARALVVGMGIVMWSGWGGYIALDGPMAGEPNGGYWVSFSVIGSYPLWMAYEASRYHLLMRRRMSIGLADPVVVNRFLLWALASLCMAASIWMVNLPAFLGVENGSAEAILMRDVSMLVTAAFGTTTVGLYWLTFFAPQWYLNWLRARTLRCEDQCLP